MNENNLEKRAVRLPKVIKINQTLHEAMNEMEEAERELAVSKD